MKVYALMVKNEELKINEYLDSVWTNKDLLEDHIEQLKNLEMRGWEYNIKETILYKY